MALAVKAKSQSLSSSPIPSQSNLGHALPLGASVYKYKNEKVAQEAFWSGYLLTCNKTPQTLVA